MLISTEVMETSLDVLLLNAHLCPPEHAAYGARTNGFALSRIHRFGGKLWQLRTVRVRGGDYHILPFVVNTGGSTWDTPIVGEPAVRRLGIRRDEAAVLNQPHDHVFEIPNALGRIARPLALEWGYRNRTHGGGGPYDVRMNLVGHELAQVITIADEYAEDIDAGDMTRDTAIRCLVRRFAVLGATPETVAREMDALLAAPSATDAPWTSGGALPLASH